MTDDKNVYLWVGAVEIVLMWIAYLTGHEYVAAVLSGMACMALIRHAANRYD